MKLRIFSIAYGEAYLQRLERACLLSMMWPKNLAALRKFAISWDLWTTPEDAERAAAIVGRVGVPVQIIPRMALPHNKMNLHGALAGQLRLCHDTGSAFLFASCDLIFGDGSIPSMLEIAQVPGICVAVPPLRVNEERFLEDMGTGPLSNGQLVRLAFRHLHQGFKDGEATLPRTSSYESGVSWRRIGEGLYAVTHRLPSCFVMQPNMADINYFKKWQKFGAFDHSFPRTLYNADRQRVIGSSDAAFIVELTPAHIATPPTIETNPNEPDRYVQALEHHKANRNLVAIWREE